MSYLLASSQLRADGESRRLDVVVDLRNPGKLAYEDIELTITFMDHSEVTFEWPDLPPFGLKGGSKAVELKLPVKKGDMLGGSYETLIDEEGSTTLFATEVKACELSYEVEGGRSHRKEIGMQASRCIGETFHAISRDEIERSQEKKERRETLKRHLEEKED